MVDITIEPIPENSVVILRNLKGDPDELHGLWEAIRKAAGHDQFTVIGIGTEQDVTIANVDGAIAELQEIRADERYERGLAEG